MNLVLSFGLLAVGIMLVVFGLNSGESFSSNMSELFTGSPSNKTIWLMIAGIVCAVAGLGSFFMLRKPTN